MGIRSGSVVIVVLTIAILFTASTLKCEAARHLLQDDEDDSADTPKNNGLNNIPIPKSIGCPTGKSGGLLGGLLSGLLPNCGKAGVGGPP